MRWLAFFLLVVVLGAGAWLVRAALQPIDYGIDASVFLDPDKAAAPVEQFIQRLDEVAPPRPKASSGSLLPCSALSPSSSRSSNAD